MLLSFKSLKDMEEIYFLMNYFFTCKVHKTIKVIKKELKKYY